MVSHSLIIKDKLIFHAWVVKIIILENLPLGSSLNLPWVEKIIAAESLKKYALNFYLVVKKIIVTVRFRSRILWL